MSSSTSSELAGPSILPKVHRSLSALLKTNSLPGVSLVSKFASFMITFDVSKSRTSHDFFGSLSGNFTSNGGDLTAERASSSSRNAFRLGKTSSFVCSGASAAAFIKYFENCSVYCLDVNISKFIFSSKDIHVYGLDINNEKELKKVLKKINLESNSDFFDIIIDDGSHYLST